MKYQQAPRAPAGRKTKQPQCAYSCEISQPDTWAEELFSLGRGQRGEELPAPPHHHQENIALGSILAKRCTCPPGRALVGPRMGTDEMVGQRSPEDTHVSALSHPAGTAHPTSAAVCLPTQCPSDHPCICFTALLSAEFFLQRRQDRGPLASRLRKKESNIIEKQSQDRDRWPKGT